MCRTASPIFSKGAGLEDLPGSLLEGFPHVCWDSFFARLPGWGVRLFAGCFPVSLLAAGFCRVVLQCRLSILHRNS